MNNLADRAAFVAPIANRLRGHDDLFVIQGDGLELFLLRKFLSAEECRELISLSELYLRPSTVLGPDPDRIFRSSDSSSLDCAKHPLVSDIDTRLSNLLGIDERFGEGMEAQRYTEGQQFRPHHDFFHETEAYWPHQNRVGGQRTWTAMICLGAPEAGGCTMFPQAGVRMKPREGNLLAWCNLNPDGAVNPMSLHCGEPVEKGMKYIITKWYRERYFTPEVGTR
jgi:prolyl 4-hydroxylase